MRSGQSSLDQNLNFGLFLDLKKERENFQETKEGEERHFQRNIVRLNEEIERERMFRYR